LIVTVSIVTRQLTLINKSITTDRDKKERIRKKRAPRVQTQKKERRAQKKKRCRKRAKMWARQKGR